MHTITLSVDLLRTTDQELKQHCLSFTSLQNFADTAGLAVVDAAQWIDEVGVGQLTFQVVNEATWASFHTANSWLDKILVK